MSRLVRGIRIGLATSLAIAAGCGKDSVASPATKEPQSFVISGVAFAHTSDGRQPIAGVPLRIHSRASGGIFIDVVSDASGRYAAAVLDGTLSIAPPTNSGYFAPCPSGVHSPVRDAIVNVHVVSAADLSTTGTPASLPRSSIYVSGTVSEMTAGGTRPVAGALVELGSSPKELAYSATLTNVFGHYLLCTTPPGAGTDIQMQLRVSKDGYASDSVSAFGGWDYSGVDVRLVRK